MVDLSRSALAAAVSQLLPTRPGPGPGRIAPGGGSSSLLRVGGRLDADAMPRVHSGSSGGGAKSSLKEEGSASTLSFSRRQQQQKLLKPPEGEKSEAGKAGAPTLTPGLVLEPSVEEVREDIPCAPMCPHVPPCAPMCSHVPPCAPPCAPMRRHALGSAYSTSCPLPLPLQVCVHKVSSATSPPLPRSPSGLCGSGRGHSGHPRSSCTGVNTSFGLGTRGRTGSAFVRSAFVGSTFFGSTFVGSAFVGSAFLGSAFGGGDVPALVAGEMEGHIPSHAPCPCAISRPMRRHIDGGETTSVAPFQPFTWDAFQPCDPHGAYKPRGRTNHVAHMGSYPPSHTWGVSTM